MRNYESIEKLAHKQTLIFDSREAFARQSLGRDIPLTNEAIDDLGRIWTAFIKLNTTGCQRYSAFHDFVKTATFGDRSEWRDFAEPYIELGIESLIDSYVAGVPADDLIAGV